MAEFRFRLDTKHSIWYEFTFDVEAETLEEAKAKAIKAFKEGDIEDIENGEFEPNLDAIEKLSVEENGNQATEELYCLEDQEFKPIVTNVEE